MKIAIECITYSSGFVENKKKSNNGMCRYVQFVNLLVVNQFRGFDISIFTVYGTGTCQQNGQAIGSGQTAILL